MEFNIPPHGTDGTKVEVEFWAETWGELTALMRKLERVGAEV